MPFLILLQEAADVVRVRAVRACPGKRVVEFYGWPLKVCPEQVAGRAADAVDVLHAGDEFRVGDDADDAFEVRAVFCEKAYAGVLRGWLVKEDAGFKEGGDFFVVSFKPAVVSFDV